MSLIKSLKIKKHQKVDYNITFNTERDKRRFIDSCKRIIRGSKEYKDYISYLKNYMDMDRCYFFNNVKRSKSGKTSIEIHHFPLTLEDIVRVIINKQLDNGEVLNDLFVAEEVCELHYKNMVGLIPLSTTIHELVHSERSNDFPIPIYAAYGMYNEFMKQYGRYIDDDDIIYEKLEYIVDATEKITPESFKDLLIEYEYIEMDGTMPLEKFMEESDVSVA